MKRIITILISFLFTFPILAQPWVQNLPQDKVQNGTLTFLEIQKAFNDYWEPFHVKGGKYINNQGVEVKAVGWKQFKRWEWYWENRVDPVTGAFPNTSAWEELQKYQSHNPGSIKSTSGNWTSVGPTSSPGGYAGLGRINCVEFHPTDNNLIYAGAASGGLWKTTDGGATWTVLSDTWPVQGCSDICVVSGSPNTIYAASGDRENTMWHFGGGQNHDNNSVGVLKSDDGGDSWNTTGLSFVPSQKIAINRLLLDPSNSDILYAATTAGVYKTTDAGVNWNQIYATQFSDMEFMPGTSSTIYGSSKAGDIYRSINSGDTWTATLTTTFGRVEMAVTPANSSIVYAVMQDLPSPVDESPVYKSTNGGGSFTRIFNSSTISLFGYQCDGSDVDNSQASYDLCIIADPTDANIVFVGGVNVWKSTDGGANWNISTHWSSTCSSTATTVHADQHYLAYQPVSNQLFLGNDGGLYKTANNGTSWSYIGSGLVTTQIYRIGVAQSTSNEFILGAQDNGTKAFLSGNWQDVIGGDGGYCFIDYSNQNYMFGEYVLGDIRRSLNHGTTWTNISSGLSGSAAFISPFIIDPNVPTTIYVGYQDVWKSTNQGDSWTKISNWAGSTIRHIAVAPSNSQTIYATTQTILYQTTDSGTSWSNITGTLPVGSSLITYFSVKNDDPNTVWVSMGNYTADRIYQTTDGGSTWISISSGLPNVPVMCVIQNKQNTSRVDLYAATDVGVYVKAGDADWQLFSSGLPTTLANELDIYYDANPGNSKIYAGTYGRGLWQSDLYESGVLNPTDFAATASSDTQIDLSWTLASGNNVILAFNTTSTFGTPVDGTSYSASSTIPGGGTVLYNGSNTTFNHTSLDPNTPYYYKIWSYDGSTIYSSGITANASTFCTLITTFPWNEGFEHAGSMPDCWTQEYVSGSNNWEMQTAGTNSHPASAHTGTYLARNRVLITNAGYITKFVSPTLDLTSVTSPFLTFLHTQEFWSPSQDELRIYYKTSAGGAWNLLATYTNTIASWTRESILLPNASSAYFIAFESTVNAGYGVCIDDVMVSTSIADFTADANISCTGNLTVNFTDNSIGSNNSWAWDIDNDGITDYTTQNPSHTYNSPGLYSVKLTVNNGVASITKENLILVMNSEPTTNTGCTLTSNSNSGNGFGIGIFRFALGNIDYTTSNDDGYYQNYSCTKWSALELNKTYDITIRTGTSNNEGAKVYIDYNDNGTFETGEAVVSFPANKDGTRTLSFTTPSSGVVTDKGIRLRVLSQYNAVPTNACDIGSYGQTEDYTVYVMGDATWTGTTSTDWQTTGNWSYNSVPGSGINAKIPSGVSNFPVLTSDAVCKNLWIQSGATLSVGPGVAFTVNGTLTNDAGNTGLLIKSDATGTGSLIHNTADVPATVERYLSAGTSNATDHIYHVVSAPVSGQAVSLFTGNSELYGLFRYDEATNFWIYSGSTSPPFGSDFVVGRGYLSNFKTNQTPNFIGTLQNGTIDFNASGIQEFTFTPGSTGWNLVGNPYSSAIDWDVTSGWTKTNVDGAIYHRDGGNWVSYSGGTPEGGNIIQVGQGVFVHANASNPELIMTNGVRINSTQAYHKDAKALENLLDISAEGNNQSDHAYIHFMADATPDFDSQYDAYKMFSDNDYFPQVYTLAGDGTDLSIDKRAIPSQNTSVPVCFKSGLNGNYSLNFSGFDSFAPAVKFLLEDKLLNQITNLKQQPSLQFSYSTNDDPQRFILHFEGLVGINDPDLPQKVSVFTFGNNLYLDSREETGPVTIEIFNLTGQRIFSNTWASSGSLTIPVSGAQGFYIVQVTGTDFTLSHKIYIR